MINLFRVIAEVRRIHQDDADLDNPRNSDADIRGAMYLGLADMRRHRPDAFVGQLVTLPDVSAVDSIPLEEMLITPLVNLTAAYVYIQNSEYVEDGTAAALLSLASAQLRRA